MHPYAAPPDLMAKFESSPPADLAEKNRPAEAQKPQPAKKAFPKLPPMPEVFTAADLEEMTFPEPVWIVPGLIPEGVTLLAGKPKIGKSYAVMNIGLALACGGKALGTISVQKQGVLYLCLEDRQRRLQDRIAALLRCGEWPSNFHLSITWPRIDQGGIPLLEKWFEEHPDVKLVIVDTLAKVKSRKASNQTQYDQDYQAVEALKSLSDIMSISVLVLHHLRKMAADEDQFDAISGSTGLTGAVDTGMVLQKERSGNTTLYVRGRDIEEAKLALSRDPSGGWTVIGDASTIARTQERNDLLNSMEERELYSLAQLARLTGKSVSNINHLLGRLREEGLVDKMAYGKYMKITKTFQTIQTNQSCQSVQTPSATLNSRGKLECSPLAHSNFSPPQQMVSEQLAVLLPLAVEEIICIKCRSFEPNPHKPNMQGNCRGDPWDGDPDQWPRLKHQCAAFRCKPASAATN